MAPTRSIRGWRWNSLADWRALSARAGPADLPPDRHPVLLPRRSSRFSRRRCAVHRRLGLPTELLDGAALRRRFPQIDFSGIDAGLYEPRLRRADGAARGADPGRRVRPRRRRLSAGGGAAAARRARRSTAITLAGGETHRRRALRLRLRPLARPALPRPARPPHLPDPAGGVLLRAASRATRASQPGRLPGWADFNGGDIYYGFPDLEGRGFKIAHDAHGAADRPGHRRPHAARPRRSPTCAPSWRAAFPRLAGRPLSEARVCQYENSSNGDFLIDRHPALGECRAGRRRLGPRLQARPRRRPLRRRAGCSARLQEAEPRFSLATKAEAENRAVH